MVVIFADDILKRDFFEWEILNFGKTFTDFFPSIKSIISQYWFRYWFGAEQVPRHYPEPMVTFCIAPYMRHPASVS